jgi:hypothetical protein
MNMEDDAVEGGVTAILGTFWGYVFGSSGDDVIVNAVVVGLGPLSCRRVRWIFSWRDSPEDNMIPTLSRASNTSQKGGKLGTP